MLGNWSVPGEYSVDMKPLNTDGRIETLQKTLSVEPSR